MKMMRLMVRPDLRFYYLYFVGMRGGPDGIGWWWFLAKDPDSKPPQNGFQRVMNAFHGVYEWTGTAECLVIWLHLTSPLESKYLINFTVSSASGIRLSQWCCTFRLSSQRALVSSCQCYFVIII